jgi:DNA-dependent RNA polymerase auxiliary subunit epsilon
VAGPSLTIAWDLSTLSGIKQFTQAAKQAEAEIKNVEKQMKTASGTQLDSLAAKHAELEKVKTGATDAIKSRSEDKAYWADIKKEGRAGKKILSGAEKVLTGGISILQGGDISAIAAEALKSEKLILSISKFLARDNETAAKIAGYLSKAGPILLLVAEIVKSVQEVKKAWDVEKDLMRKTGLALISDDFTIWEKRRLETISSGKNFISEAIYGNKLAAEFEQHKQRVELVKSMMETQLNPLEKHAAIMGSLTTLTDDGIEKLTTRKKDQINDFISKSFQNQLNIDQEKLLNLQLKTLEYGSKDPIIKIGITNAKTKIQDDLKNISFIKELEDKAGLEYEKQLQKEMKAHPGEMIPNDLKKRLHEEAYRSIIELFETLRPEELKKYAKEREAAMEADKKAGKDEWAQQKRKDEEARHMVMVNFREKFLNTTIAERYHQWFIPAANYD